MSNIILLHMSVKNQNSVFTTILLISTVSILLTDMNSCSLILKMERGPRVLRKIFGPKKDEVTGEWRRLHTEELYDLYSSPNVIRLIKLREMRLSGHIAPIGDRRSAFRVLLGRQEGKRVGVEFHAFLTSNIYI
jgi:hypothetical protein